MPSFGYNNRAEIRAERESSVFVIWSIYGHEKNGLTEKNNWSWKSQLELSYEQEPASVAGAC